MTTEIEKRFFERFGIEKRHKHQAEIDNGDPRFTGISDSNSYYDYPEITDRKLLKLIVILQNFIDIDFTDLYFQNVECLKIEILNQLMNFCNNKIKTQVKALFEE